MPRQRNHPHHHAHREQPRFSTIWRGHVYDYPKSRATRSAAGGMGRRYVAALCAAGAILLLVLVFSLLFGGH
jgi:hypothetical protein